MSIELKIPQISEGVDSATVSEVLVSEGDEIQKDDAILTLETDKASADVPASDGGTVEEVKVSEGDEVSVGDVVVLLSGNGDKKEEKDSDEKEGSDDDEKAEGKSEEEDSSKEDEDSSEGEDDESDEEDEVKQETSKDEEEDRQKQKPDDDQDDGEDDGKDEEGHQEAEKETKSEKSEEEKSDDDGSDIPASPKVRRLAREKGIDLEKIKGSGPEGRILEEDLEEEKSSPDTSETKKSGDGLEVREELSQIRITTAKRTQESWTEIPHVFQFDEADISRVEEFIEKNQDKKEAKLTITAIAVKIAASALIRFPKFNASIDMENHEAVYKKYVNIGVAVDTPKGLLVPVLRDAEQKNLFEIAEEITDLAEKAREGELGPDQMQGGTFTISNLGGIGGTAFTPIILKPQVAILGLSRAQIKTIHEDGKEKQKTLLPLSLSYDHRLIDGAEGAKFISFISKALADPFKAMMGV